MTPTPLITEQAKLPLLTGTIATEYRLPLATLVLKAAVPSA